MSKIRNFEDKQQSLKFRKWVSSKQALDFVGHLIIILDITDSKGNRTRQIGESTTSNMKKRFEIAFDNAYINAVYKHFKQIGEPILDSGQSDVKELIYKAKLIKWNIRYYDENLSNEPKSNYVKVVTIDKKRYTTFFRNGQLISKEPYKKIPKNNINNLIDERTGNLITTKKEQLKLDKNYFSKPRKNKRYID